MAATTAERTTTEPRALTDAEIQHYWDNGWAKIDQLIPAEHAAALLNRVKERMGEGGDAHTPRASDWTGNKTSNNWLSYHGLVFEDDLFKAFYFSKTMGRNMQRLLRRDVHIRHHLDIIACKMPKGQPGSGPSIWHQDFIANGHDRAGSAVFWLALADVPAERGVMRFRSGSHKLGELGSLRGEWKVGDQFHGEEKQDMTDHGDNYLRVYPFLDEECPISPPLDLRAGDATIHHSLVLHSAPANSTDKPRWVLLAAYAPGDVLYTGRPGNLAIEKAALDGETLEIGEEIVNEPVVFP
jgi:hypothetical protein